MAKRLEGALARFGRRRSVSSDGQLSATPAGAAFRAAVDHRLQALERQIDEVKGRINGLLFMVAGTALAEVIRGLLS